MAHSVSIVNYYNTTPFIYGIKHTGFQSLIELQLDIPSVCAQKIKNREVEIGLVPVAILPELKNYHIITDFCIGAVGKVDSVKLFSEKPLEELTHILLDYQSKTSVKLVQVLNKYFWKKNIQFLNASKGFETSITDTIGAVIIGDRTFGLDSFPYEYDLAEEWQKHTQLPFVFACWVSNVQLDNQFIDTFNKALGFGVNNIEDSVLEFPNLTPNFDALDYLKNKISYQFNSDKKLALAKFLDFLTNL